MIKINKFLLGGELNMYKDEMTPKERMTAFAKGEPMDRLPAF